MLTPWIREYVKKYSFIIDTKFTMGMFFMQYKVGDKVKFKKVPYRGTKENLVKAIEDIKKDIDYYEDKKRRIQEGQYDTKDLPFLFAYSWSERK